MKNIKSITFILALLVSVGSTQALNSDKQSAVSPDGICKVFLNDSFVPKTWQHISKCPNTKNTVATKKRTVKALPNYLKKLYQQPETKKANQTATVEKKLHNLRPRNTVGKKSYVSYQGNRRGLPNYNSAFSRRFQISTGTDKTENPKTVVRPYRNYRISASNVTKKRNDHGTFSGQTWRNRMQDRRRTLNRTSSRRYWRSLNALQSDVIKNSKPKKTEVHAKLKQRYVGAPRMGSLENVSTK